MRSQRGRDAVASTFEGQRRDEVVEGPLVLPACLHGGNCVQGRVGLIRSIEGWVGEA